MPEASAPSKHLTPEVKEALAIVQARREPFDLVLTDIDIPIYEALVAGSLAAWALCTARRNAGLVDICWSLFFVASALVYALSLGATSVAFRSSRPSWNRLIRISP